MRMTDEEIVRDYRQAANKSKQIKILADLNCCSASEIKAVLAKAGVEGAKMPERIVKRKADREPAAVRADIDAGGGNDVRPAVPAVEKARSIYERIETILTALPEDAAVSARKAAEELCAALLREYIARRIGGSDETD